MPPDRQHNRRHTKIPRHPQTIQRRPRIRPEPRLTKPHRIRRPQRMTLPTKPPIHHPPPLHRRPRNRRTRGPARRPAGTGRERHHERERDRNHNPETQRRHHGQDSRPARGTCPKPSEETGSEGTSRARMLFAVAKKASTPPPPVQAPKRRDTRTGSGLSAVPRWAIVGGVVSSPGSSSRSSSRRREAGQRQLRHLLRPEGHDGGRRLTIRDVKPLPPKNKAQLPRGFAHAHVEGEVEPPTRRLPAATTHSGGLGFLSRSDQPAAGRPQRGARRRW